MNGNLSDCSAHALSLHIHTTWMLWACEYIRLSQYGQRIEINQKSNSRENLSPLRKYAINTPFWRHPCMFPRHFWLLSDIFRLRKLTFCWRLVLIYEKAGGQNYRWNLREWSIDRVGWRRWDARDDMREDINFKGTDIELHFRLISILWSGYTSWYMGLRNVSQLINLW